MERKTYKELVKEVDKRTVALLEKMNKALENPDDLVLRVEVVYDLTMNIEANKQMLELVNQLIKDNEESTKIGLFTKLKNVYYLVKIHNYYCATINELLETSLEHGFAIDNRGDKNER